MSSSASLDSAAPTKPTGMPITAAGGMTPGSCSISSRRNKAVGALPITTTDPANRSRHNSTAAAVRVVPSLRRERRHARIGQRADHGIVGRQPRPRDAVGHHLGVAENRRARAQRGGSGGAETGREHDVVGDFDHAAGVDDPHRDLFVAGIETVESCFGANDRKRALVDRRAVGLVGVVHDAARALTGAAAIRSITLLRRVTQ